MAGEQGAGNNDPRRARPALHTAGQKPCAPTLPSVPNEKATAPQAGRSQLLRPSVSRSAGGNPRAAFLSASRRAARGVSVLPSRRASRPAPGVRTGRDLLALQLVYGLQFLSEQPRHSESCGEGIYTAVAHQGACATRSTCQDRSCSPVLLGPITATANTSAPKHRLVSYLTAPRPGEEPLYPSSSNVLECLTVSLKPYQRRIATALKYHLQGR